MTWAGSGLGVVGRFVRQGLRSRGGASLQTREEERLETQGLLKNGGGGGKEGQNSLNRIIASNLSRGKT